MSSVVQFLYRLINLVTIRCRAKTARFLAGPLSIHQHEDHIRENAVGKDAQTRPHACSHTPFHDRSSVAQVKIRTVYTPRRRFLVYVLRPPLLKPPHRTHTYQLNLCGPGRSTTARNRACAFHWQNALCNRRRLTRAFKRKHTISRATGWRTQCGRTSNMRAAQLSRTNSCNAHYCSYVPIPAKRGRT